MGTGCHTQRVVSGALHCRPSVRLPLPLCTHLVLIHKPGLRPHRIARGPEGPKPEKTLYKLLAYEPRLGVPRAGRPRGESLDVSVSAPTLVGVL